MYVLCMHVSVRMYACENVYVNVYLCYMYVCLYERTYMCIIYVCVCLSIYLL